MTMQDARSLPPAAQESIRRRAVQSVVHGRTQVEVAETFGVTRQAVGKWMKAYGEGGARSLRAKRKGRPRGGSLRPWQAAQIAKTVVDRPPEQLKLPFHLWTREAVAQLIEHRFHVHLSVWTVGRYLQRWGFTPQKPLRRAFERDPQRVRSWLRHHYPALRRRAKLEKARIYWGDEMGLRSDHTAGRSYSRRGQTPVIPGTGQRFGCNMVSAITNQGQLSFMVFKKRFRAGVFIDFMRRLTRHNRGKVYLIVDAHPVHRSQKVGGWLSRHAQELRLFFLPPYSPDLNPDEILNQDVKSNGLGRRRPRHQHELMTQIRGCLRRRQRQPHIVRRYFEEKSVRYAAP